MSTLSRAGIHLQLHSPEPNVLQNITRLSPQPHVNMGIIDAVSQKHRRRQQRMSSSITTTTIILEQGRLRISQSTLHELEYF